MAPTPLIVGLCALCGVIILLIFVFCFRSWLRHGGDIGDDEGGEKGLWMTDMEGGG